MKKRARKKWIRQYKRKMREKNTWDLSYNVARYVLPRLKRFRQVVNGHPVKDDVKTMDDWYKVLDKIILAFDYIVDADDWWILILNMIILPVCILVVSQLISLDDQDALLRKRIGWLL